MDRGRSRARVLVSASYRSQHVRLQLCEPSPIVRKSGRSRAGLWAESEPWRVVTPLHHDVGAFNGDGIRESKATEAQGGSAELQAALAKQGTSLAP